MYDFGASLLYSYDNSVLKDIGIDFPDMAKVESRTNLDNIKFIHEYMTNKIGFMPDALYRNSKIVLNKYKKNFMVQRELNLYQEYY